MLEYLLAQISKWAIPALFFFFLLTGMLRRVPVYEAFVRGAAEGFQTAVKIIPYMIAMFVAIKVFRVSGGMDLVSGFLAPLLNFFGIPAEVLPLAMMRPLSGSSALGIATELIKTYGPDSFIGRLASVMQGSTDTTFFIITIYFGSVGIRHYRHALALGLFADLVSFMSSVYICHRLFG
ncbi:MAG: Spore maturation protein B [Thermoanaerobacterales bacterium 50_218]|nr:MAG: Spore maturation protein B [Thermoanaerobacterales bacterium 50_218]HAA89464.1 spore maturation protein [Peptococcaceae bacterium]